MKNDKQNVILMVLMLILAAVVHTAFNTPKTQSETVANNKNNTESEEVVLASGTAFRYVTEDGVLSFTDAVDRVPVRYQEVAEEVTLEKFKDYNKLSIVVKKEVTND